MRAEDQINILNIFENILVAADVAEMKKEPDQENQDLLDNLLKDLDQPGPSGSGS